MSSVSHAWPIWSTTQTVVQVLFAVAFGVIGVRRVRGGRPPLSVLTSFALFSLGIGIVLARRQLTGLPGESAGLSTPTDRTIEGSMSSLSYGLGFALDIIEINAFSAGVALFAVAVGAALALFTIDTSAIGSSPEWNVSRGARSDSLPARQGEGGRTTAIVGAVAVLSAGVVRLGLRTRLVWFDALVVSLVLLALPVAVAAGRPLRALVTHRARTEASHALGTFVLCAVAWTASVLLLEAPLFALEVRGQVGESIGHGCRGPRPMASDEIVQPWLDRRAFILLVDAIACLAVFAPALSAGLRTKVSFGRGGIGIAGGLALVGLVEAGGAVRLGASVVRAVATLHAPYAKAESAIARTGVHLPVSKGWSRFIPPARWIMSPGGILDLGSTLPPPCHGESCSGHMDFLADAVAADGAIPVEHLIMGVPRERPGPLTVDLLAAPSRPPYVAPLGTLAGLFRTDLIAYRITLDETLAEDRGRLDPSGGWIGSPPADTAIVPDAEGSTIFLFQQPEAGRIVARSNLAYRKNDAVDEPDHSWIPIDLRSSYGTTRIVVVARAGMTVSELCVLLAKVGSGNIVVTANRAPFERAMVGSTSVPL